MSYSLVRSSKDATVGSVVAIVAVAAMAVIPVWGSSSTQLTLIEVFTFLSLAQMWNLLAGFGGLVSVGQQGFVGIAAYTLFVLAEKNGLDPFIAIVLAGFVVAVFSVPVAAFAFRLQGGYFAIGTWVIAEVFRLAALQIDSLGAGNVQSLTVKNTFSNYGIDLRRDLIYWSALALAAGSTFVVVMVLRSRLGLALRAVRDNPEGASGLGVDVTRARLVIWVMVAGWTGFTGALIHLNTATVTNRDAFSVLSWTALVIFIVIIGGVGSTTGPIIGVAIFWFISDRFQDQDTWRFIILGGVAALMAVFAPKGVYGLIQRWRPIQFFPVRARLRGPGVDNS
jgi:branched-chain amino acid transport system permease protein